jgi:D-serine deaminase-like pyridoxal phosphate-dependent protein
MTPNPNIIYPTLLLDVRRCRKNIERLSKKFTEHGIAFRPHFKTHQSREIGGWFRDYGVDKITVSSLRMAAYFAHDGWDDITLAFPVNLLEVSAINALAERIRLNLVVEDHLVIKSLDRMLQYRVGIFIKVDTGYHRTGLESSEIEKIETCMSSVERSAHMHFMGFIAHAGHTYKAKNAGEINTIYRSSIRELASLRAHYRMRHPQSIVSFGDTPGASIVQDLDGIDEMRPGNFVFYDLMQVKLGSCLTDDIAVAMICPIVACHHERREYVIYGGGIHFSKEFTLRDDQDISYGSVVQFANGIWEPEQEIGYVSQLTQEHGVIKSDTPHMRPGQLVAVLPVHSCMTAQCLGGYIDQKGQRIDHFGGVKQ